MSRFQPFVMERMMSKWEQTVDINLSESGVHPMLLRELLADAETAVEDLLATDLNYPEVNGSIGLRRNIAALYDNATPESVLVTVGAIEANFLAVSSLLGPGDKIVIMRPNYMQVWGMAKNLDLDVETFDLLEEEGWAPDLSQLAEKVTPETKMIAVCNPNNPTGRIMTEAEMDAVVREAARVGAWILADEVYGGAEREGRDQAPSFFGRYDKVLAVGSLSKAYGLPGLRIGWVVAPKEAIDEMWARHEYVTISTTRLANKLAEIAVSAEVRPRIIARTRRYIRDGWPVLEDWMRGHGNVFSFTPPGAAAIAFVRYHMDHNSTAFCERLRAEKSVLVVPGDHFGLDHHLRISFGLPHDYLTEGLNRIHDMMLEIRA